MNLFLRDEFEVHSQIISLSCITFMYQLYMLFVTGSKSNETIHHLTYITFYQQQCIIICCTVIDNNRVRKLTRPDLKTIFSRKGEKPTGVSRFFVLFAKSGSENFSNHLYLSRAQYLAITLRKPHVRKNSHLWCLEHF